MSINKEEAAFQEAVREFTRGTELVETLPRGLKNSLNGMVRRQEKENGWEWYEKNFPKEEAREKFNEDFWSYMETRQYFQIPEKVYKALEAVGGYVIETGAVNAEGYRLWSKYFWLRITFGQSFYMDSIMRHAYRWHVENGGEE